MNTGIEGSQGKCPVPPQAREHNDGRLKVRSHYAIATAFFCRHNWIIW